MTAHYRRTQITVAVLSLLVLLAAPLSTGPAAARQTEPVTLYSSWDVAYPHFDPQLADNTWDTEINEQLFLGLTDTHPVTGDIMPELATSWTISADGRVWTFTLRDDVPWVHWNAAAERAEVVRTVTAHDVVYGMQRACDPRLDAYYTSIVANVISGCDVLARQRSIDVTDDDYSLVHVYALDDTTLEVHLQYPAGYVFSMVGLWNLRPVPREIIEEHGLDWTEIAHIVTNGPYLFAEWNPDARLVLLRNPYLPQDLQGPGNIERVISIRILKAESTAVRDELFLTHQLDMTGRVGPDEEFLSEASGRPVQRMETFVDYIGMAMDNPPFDNVHVRRAFAAAVDRSALATGQWGIGVPMRHLTPPGIFGAPPIDEVGVGFDPQYARAQLALAGYPDCEGFPTISVMTFDSRRPSIQALVDGAVTVLGCDAALFEIEIQDYTVMMQSINSDLPPELRSHIWAMGWGADYPDANNWVGDLLGCDQENPFQRSCSEIDDLITQAATETDIVTRVALYRDIEERFFGPEGEFPIIPLYARLSTIVVKVWVDGPFTTDGQFGGQHYDWYTIDQAVQLAARGG